MFLAKVMWTVECLAFETGLKKLKKKQTNLWQPSSTIEEQIHPVGNFEGSLNRVRQGFVDICIPTNALVNHYPRVSMDSNINLVELLSVFCTFAVCWYFLITDQLLHVSLVQFCLYTEKMFL